MSEQVSLRGTKFRMKMAEMVWLLNWLDKIC